MFSISGGNMYRRSYSENDAGCRHGLFAVAVAVAVTATGLAPGDVLAQESTGQNQLEEIIVTATKAAAGVDVSKVPVSITAFDANMIDAVNAKDFADLAALTPGVVLTETQTFGLALTNIQIRGISSRTSEPTTGMYLDDIPFTTIGNNTNIGGSVAMPVVFDLERVEVLRGPQGTLYGFNTAGGAVNFISKKPTGEFGFRQMLDFGNRNMFRSMTAVNLPKWHDISAKATHHAHTGNPRHRI